MWNLSTGKKTDLKGHAVQIHAVAFNRDSKTLASGNTGISSFKIGVTGKTSLISGSLDGTCKLWDVAARKRKPLSRITAKAPCLALSGDAKILATWRKKGGIKLWNVETAASKRR